MMTTKILMASSECFPYARTGGLSEVVPSLASALGKMDDISQVAIVIPFYQSITREFKVSEQFKKENFTASITVNKQEHIGELYSTTLSKGVTLYFIKNDYYYDRDGIYGNKHGDFRDNAERFFFFSRFVVEMVRKGFWEPDIIHIHDWHVSLIPALIKSTFKNEKTLSRIKTLLTIHNLGYQGILTAQVVQWAGFDLKDFSEAIFGLLGKRNRLNFLKTGIIFSDKINTVSPTYAKEIQTTEYGFGLDRLLRRQATKLSGILNAGNYNDWNPEKDPYIPARYSMHDLSGKSLCKERLSETFGFDYEPEIPIIGVVARLTYQKGLDFLKTVWDEFKALPMRFVLLGNGDRELETFFLTYSSEDPQKFGVRIEFDIKLSHLIHAGSDMFLVPSRYEPCGLTQIHAMKYGTVPIVRATGGLEDTVRDFNLENRSGNGFKFISMNAYDLLEKIKTAVSVYQDKDTWRQLMLTGMRENFCYAEAAKKYLNLYRSML